jgi:hypothetical protein
MCLRNQHSLLLLCWPVVVVEPPMKHDGEFQLGTRQDLYRYLKSAYLDLLATAAALLPFIAHRGRSYR